MLAEFRDRVFFTLLSFVYTVHMNKKGLGKGLESNMICSSLYCTYVVYFQSDAGRPD